MAPSTAAPPLERCSRCGLETYGSNVVQAAGQRLHEHCFVCERCNAPFVDGACYPIGDQLLCEDCRDEHVGPWCAKCGLSLASKERLIGQNAHWHPACFCCTDCGVQLDGDYCEHADKVLCVGCYDSKHGVRCAGCRLVVKGGSVLAEGETWHAACFVCTACAVQLVADEAAPAGDGGGAAGGGRGDDDGDGGACDYYVLGGRPFCRAHYVDQCTALCAGCGEPADLEPVAALGAVFHRCCLICAHCKAPVGGTAFIEHEGVPYCQPDYYALFGGRATDARAPAERTHALLYRARPDALRELAAAHAEQWHEVKRELREEGARAAGAHLFGDGTLVLTVTLDEGRDAEAALQAIFERSRACTQWARLLRLCAPPHVAAERSFVFETAADPLELVERPRLPALAESAPRRQGMGLRPPT
jgi:L-rhamnose mutarotase